MKELITTLPTFSRIFKATPDIIYSTKIQVCTKFTFKIYMIGKKYFRGNVCHFLLHLYIAPLHNIIHTLIQRTVGEGKHLNKRENAKGTHRASYLTIVVQTTLDV